MLLTSTVCAIKLGNEILPFSLTSENLAILETSICNKASHIWEISEWKFSRETARDKKMG